MTNTKIQQYPSNILQIKTITTFLGTNLIIRALVAVQREFSFSSYSSLIHEKEIINNTTHWRHTTILQFLQKQAQNTKKSKTYNNATTSPIVNNHSSLPSPFSSYNYHKNFTPKSSSIEPVNATTKPIPNNTAT